MSNRPELRQPEQPPKRDKKDQLRRLLDIIGKDQVSIDVVVQLEGKPARRTVIFFKFDPSVIPMDLGRSLLKSASGMIHRTIDTAHMYEGMVDVSETEVEIQKRRYDHAALFEKIAREDNRQEMWIALDTTSGNVVGVGFLDPQVIQFSVDSPEFEELVTELGQDKISVVEGKGIYVDPRYKRKKLGVHILELIEFYTLSRLGHPLMFLSPFAAEALKFYTKNGYRSLGQSLTDVELGGTKVKFLFWAFVIPLLDLAEKHGNLNNIPPDEDKQ